MIYCYLHSLKICSPRRTVVAGAAFFVPDMRDMQQVCWRSRSRPHPKSTSARTMCAVSPRPHGSMPPHTSPEVHALHRLSRGHEPRRGDPRLPPLPRRVLERHGLRRPADALPSSASPRVGSQTWRRGGDAHPRRPRFRVTDMASSRLAAAPTIKSSPAEVSTEIGQLSFDLGTLAWEHQRSSVTPSLGDLWCQL